MKKLLIVLLVVLSVFGCTSTKKVTTSDRVPLTAEESLGKAQIGVAEQKQLLAAAYFKSVSDCNKEKDFVFKFTKLECPVEGCMLALNASAKQCETADSRNAFIAAMNNIREPVGPKGFYDMVSDISGDFKDLGIGLVSNVKDIAVSSNVGLLGTAYMLEKMSNNVGDRYSATGDVVVGGNKEVTGGHKVGGSISETSVGGNSGGSYSSSDSSMTAGTGINTGSIENVGADKVLGNKVSENNPSSSTVDNSNQGNNSGNSSSSSVITKQQSEQPIE